MHHILTPAGYATLTRPLDLSLVDEATLALARHIAVFGVFKASPLVLRVEIAKTSALSPFRSALAEANARLLAAGEKVGVARLGKVAFAVRSARYEAAREAVKVASNDLENATESVDYHIGITTRLLGTPVAR